MTPDQVRRLLSECVTVVQPGETLVVRVPWGTSWMQVRELQDAADQTAEWLDLPFKTLILPGDELGVAQEPDFMTRTTAEPLDGTVLTIRLTHQPTGITVVARDRAEGIVKLRKALTDRARREYDLQEAQRRAERKAAQAQEA